MSLRLGIDVGGTNTDAAVLDDGGHVVAWVKTPTTADTGLGVACAIDEVLAAGVDPSALTRVMLGTTHCTNAIVERRGLARVGVIRIGAPATTAVPPMEGWPEDLRTAVDGGTGIVKGGIEHDGRIFATVDDDEVREMAASFRGHVDAVAVSGVFSPIDTSQERHVGELVGAFLNVPVTLSSDVGSLGLLERENAAVLNAALRDTLETMLRGLEDALKARGIRAMVYVGQNDGTLMQLDYARQFPVFTVGSGLTNSIRGAAHLSRVSNGVVVDIGGTTTDVGVLIDGFPRVSTRAVEIGGIATNFRMPDLVSVGLGGGSIVRLDEGGGTRVGPDSVAYRITEHALAFGGATMTATDIAIAAGRGGEIGTVATHIPEVTVCKVDGVIRALLEDAIDRMKSSIDPVPLILVGGGSIIAPGHLEGVSQVIHPPHAAVANAVGAALGDVAGQAERLGVAGEGYQSVVADTIAQATASAIRAGADPDTVEIVAIDELPVPYMDEPTMLIRVRAIGRIADEEVPSAVIANEAT